MPILLIPSARPRLRDTDGRREGIGRRGEDAKERSGKEGEGEKIKLKKKDTHHLYRSRRGSAYLHLARTSSLRHWAA